MTTKRLAAILLALVGVGLVLFGLLFLVGAAGRLSRYLVAAASMGFGALAAGFGVRVARSLDALTPARLEAAILGLARHEDGELSEAELKAGLQEKWEPARRVLDEMVLSGDCTRTMTDGTLFYVFRDLLARLTVRRCEYCGTELPLARVVPNCPNCGGTVSTRVERVSASQTDDAYSMDE